MKNFILALKALNYREHPRSKGVYLKPCGFIMFIMCGHRLSAYFYDQQNKFSLWRVHQIKDVEDSIVKDITISISCAENAIWKRFWTQYNDMGFLTNEDIYEVLL